MSERTNEKSARDFLFINKNEQKKNEHQNTHHNTTHNHWAELGWAVY